MNGHAEAEQLHVSKILNIVLLLSNSAPKVCWFENTAMQKTCNNNAPDYSLPKPKLLLATKSSPQPMTWTRHKLHDV